MNAMPFIPHTQEDIEEMLAIIGAKSIDALFDEIPSALKIGALENIPLGISEIELNRLMRERARLDSDMLCFIGAGAYEHHIPAAVWEIATRGEFYTSYTPYQAEASQGTLQLIYEFQTMIASLTGMEVANASMYDGATALAEAVLMAIRLSKKEKTDVLIPRTVHPFYRDTVKTIIKQQNLNVIEVPYHPETGRVDITALPALLTSHVAALVIPQPNFFGVLEEVDELTNWASEQSLLSIGVVNPLAMSLLKPPGQWGRQGADIACGEGQPLGVPLSSGGPYYGFLCSKREHVRQMPGRIVGCTIDKNGKPGYVLTLQAREQHIRRGKATSNICTNQGLMVTAATIFMSLVGPQGLRQIALACHQKARELKQELVQSVGLEPVFSSPFFHEIVVRIKTFAADVQKELTHHNIQAGYLLNETYGELEDCLLLCATETKTTADIKLLARYLEAALRKKKGSKGGKIACQV